MRKTGATWRVPLIQPGEPHCKVVEGWSGQAETILAMPEAGLEPARGKAPWDFKSHVSTSSTTPACGQIVGEG